MLASLVDTVVAAVDPYVAVRRLGLVRNTVLTSDAIAGIALVPDYMAKLTIPGIVLKRMSDVSATSDLSVMWNPANRSPIVGHVVERFRDLAPA